MRVLESADGQPDALGFEGSRFCPMPLCDVCHVPILDMDGANMVWWLFLSGERSEPRLVHKGRCDRIANNSKPDDAIVQWWPASTILSWWAEGPTEGEEWDLGTE